MEKVLNLGRWIFPLSFSMYVGLHFGKPEVGASFVPDFLPFPYFWNYLTALCIIAFIISALIRKYDKLAYSLMALYVILMALLVHLPMALGNLPVDMMGMDVARTQKLEMINVFRNIMVTGALLGFAKYVAEDNRIIR
ncbi:hypothetical protein [Fulvivirga sp.]|uniref:hypothetical protein n=1 Tax=Fulvivirga sp. TaxID=1931237 RepID=UPI0032EEC060